MFLYEIKCNTKIYHTPNRKAYTSLHSLQVRNSNSQFNQNWSGFHIGYFGGIVVNAESVIGKNCNISHGVTIGQGNRGKNKGCSILGNNIYIGPGAKIIGAVKIGNNVAIGVNCVVTKDIPDNSVVVGIPGKVISQNGSVGYINKTDYDNKIGYLQKAVETS